MSDSDDKPSSEIILIAIAWAQFLAMAAVIDKADMRDVSAAWKHGITSIWLWQWDWTKFGGLAVALNILAVCFLTLPALAQRESRREVKSRPPYVRAFLLKLRNIGFYAWLFSFMAFIGYLNTLSVIFLYGALAIIFLLALYYRFLYTDAK
jgi:hypothetical protein